MALDITKPSFGTKKNTVVGDKPKAQLWLNVGYEIEVETSEGKEKRFVSLPFGSPLDTMEEVPTNSSNEVFAALQAAKNDLLRQLVSAGTELPSGGELLVNLQVQIRRVNAPTAAISAAENPFIKKVI